MKIIDNFLTPSYADAIEDQFNSPQQEWYFNKNASYIEEEEKFHMKYGLYIYIFIWSMDSPYSMWNMDSVHSAKKQKSILHREYGLSIFHSVDGYII